ncbi:MAG: GDSL-type esterase/lipase family protein [Luteimonas sp.]
MKLISAMRLRKRAIPQPVQADADNARQPWRIALVAATALASISMAILSATSTAASPAGDRSSWVSTWTASPQPPESPRPLPLPAQFENQTIRQIVHTSVGGDKVRVRFSNEFGTTPLLIGAAHIALQNSGAGIIPASDRTLTFGGLTSVTLPAGAPVLSDPVDLDVPALGNLAVSLYLPISSPASTFHSLGVQTTYVSTAGDHSATASFPTATTTESWFFMTAVTVDSAARSTAIVALGDSITDGFGSTVNTDRSYPSLLAARLQARPDLRHLAVVDQGISGNRTLHDSFGPNALARFDRDVLAVPGTRQVILLEGINNIGFPGFLNRPHERVDAQDIIAGHRQLIARAHAHGLT